MRRLIRQVVIIFLMALPSVLAAKERKPFSQIVPAKIQAESYSSMSGVSTETTSDAGGGQNVGGISNGDWMDFDLNVTQTGSYTIEFRVATPSSGAAFELRKSNGTALTIQNVPVTGGWQTWTTVTVNNISLTSGVQTLRVISINGAGWNFNWMDFSLPGSSNQSPSANAGSDQSITLPTNNLTLSGSGTDPDGTIASYAWSQISGTTATISSASSASTTITGLNTAGTRVFRLTVTDNNGATATDDVSITVNAAPPPTVNAGSDQTITLPTSQVTLSGTATANNGGSISSYTWTLQSGTGGTITSPSLASTTVTGLTAGTRTYRLTVTDNTGGTSYADIVVNVNSSSGVLPISGGGTGQSSFTAGYIKSNGSVLSSVSTIPGSDVSGNINGNAANVTGLVAVANGGTGASSFTTGYLKSNGTAISSSATIAGADVSGNISGNAVNVTGLVSVANGGTGASSFTTGYLKSNGTAISSSATIAGADVSGNISGNAANVTGLVSVTNGGTGATSASAGLNNLLPSQSGNANKVLSTNGTSTLWVTPSAGASSQWTTAGTLIHYTAGNVAIGTSTVNAANKLTVEGTVAARKVRVTSSSNWADYVFAPNYKLPTLAEVEAFIKKHQRLPDVPSAAEVSKNGFDVADQQALLLKKIEELTLYIIELNKADQIQKAKISQLEKVINNLLQ